MDNAKVLVVEDEINVGSTLVERFQKEAFEVTWTKSVTDAKQAIEKKHFDLVLLDIGLPDGSGFDVSQFVRKQSPATSIIFLTAYGNPDDRIRGLEEGAEDYIVKPFHLRELLLRVQNTLKRSKNLSTQEPLTLGKARVDFSKFQIESDQQIHSLTHKEWALLRLFVSHRGKVISRNEILDEVWSPDEYPSPRTVDNFVLRLRKWIEDDPENPRFIKSIRGVGYQLL